MSQLVVRNDLIELIFLLVLSVNIIINTDEHNYKRFLLKDLTTLSRFKTNPQKKLSRAAIFWLIFKIFSDNSVYTD